MKSKRIKLILLAILVSFLTFLKMYKYDINDKETIKVSKNNEEVKETAKIEATTYVSPIEDLQIKYDNYDIKAELRIDYIGLDTVITQSNDNYYYLKYDAYKNRNDFGNPFLDYRNESNLSKEKQINIYSHNFYNNYYNQFLPFSKLELYLNRETFNNAKEVLLYTKESLLRYQVYAIKIVTKQENEHMIMDAKSDELWQYHLNKLLSNTLYCTDDCHLDSNDELLVLQTCNYNPSDSFILVIARKVI